MTAILNLHNTVQRRALSSRDTARSISPVVKDIMEDGKITIDFAQMAVVAPSFFDEFLRVIRDSSQTNRLVIDLTNTSDHQFTRFRAVCRAHGLATENIGPNHWRITKP